MEGFRTLDSFRGNNPSDKLCATFKAFWELWEFSREELEGAAELGPVMTLSGSAIYARATQCKVYLEENWGQVGLDVLRAIENALSSENLRTGKCPSQDLEYDLQRLQMFLLLPRQRRSPLNCIQKTTPTRQSMLLSKHLVHWTH